MDQRIDLFDACPDLGIGIGALGAAGGDPGASPGLKVPVAVVAELGGELGDLAPASEHLEELR